MSDDRLRRQVDPLGTESATSAVDPAISAKLLVLRMELYAAAQSLKGEALAEFWKLIDEIRSVRDAGR